jgi:hypothetical protein
MCDSISVTSKLNLELSRFHVPVVEKYDSETVPFEQLWKSGS